VLPAPTTEEIWERRFVPPGPVKLRTSAVPKLAGSTASLKVKLIWLNGAEPWTAGVWETTRAPV